MGPAPETATSSSSIDVDQLTAALQSAGRYTLAGRIGTFPLRHGWLRLSHEGRDNVPSTGGVILAANHLAFIDSLLLMYSLDRPVAFLGKSEYLDHPIARRIFPATGTLPLDRTGRHARITLDHATRILEQGGIVGVHPEGTRSRDGLLGPAHRGVAQLALRPMSPSCRSVWSARTTYNPSDRRSPHSEARSPSAMARRSDLDGGQPAAARPNRGAS